MKEYSDMKYFFSLSFTEAFELIKALYNRISEEMLFERWIPYQAEIGFNEFKNSLSTHTSKNDTRKTDEIMKDVEKILNSVRGGANGTI